MEVHIKKETKNYQLRISVQEHGQEVGSAFLSIIYNDKHADPYGLMENVYVSPEYRGKGFGTLLVKELILQAKKVGCYKLIGQSRYGKEGVHQLYIRQGFLDHGKNFRMDFFSSESLQEE